ncbi:MULTISPECIES: DNA polymerase III subunit delta [Flavobacteriaceae]|uniref:DNA polymerase III subunit delta n=2 Tax=Flavobacteriaceae TaxID=49546 RepID=A0A4Y8AWR7_9FLAO|nr:MULTISPECIES: DNA polymerase III subunit delta [Flavobacteriaceae]TEW76931.1 DNA polymerase III subunit delta [Gramella jeungdoensis]GGK59214.1 DNA polymerase III subunit delta [Lutibacter litoralis]
MNDITKIVSDINNGNIKPIYFLMGEEPYYIDKISEYIENNILAEEEKGFNQMVLYGRDVTIEEIIDNAKRFPMMAEKQVVIVKEAQDLSRTIEKLVSYAKQPQPSTVLVICYKYKKIDKRKSLYKEINKVGLVYESKKLYENHVADWIRRVLAGKKYKIDTKATLMLIEFLGTDLSKINNELNKLMLVLPKEATITPEAIEDNIGISKDYNNFELRKAVGERDVLKANRIINHFAQNQKANPMIMTISLLNSFFTQLLIYHSLKDKSKNSVAKALGVNPFFVSDYTMAAKNYPMRKVSQVIGLLRNADVKSKGVGANALPAGDILKELLFKIIH